MFLSQVIEGNEAFGLKLLGLLGGAPDAGNVLLSPASLSMALAMVLNGARGETAACMAEGLGLGGLKREAINADFRALAESWATPEARVTVSLANAIWANKGLSLAPTFVERLATAFAARVAELDFADPAAADVINAWVREATAGNIDNLVDPALLATSPLVLTNAVYFRGLWATPFDPARTESRPFHLASGERRMLPLMRRSGEMPYFENDRVQIVRLSYGRGRFALVVALPRPGIRPADLVAGLSPATWREWQRRCRDRTGRLLLPRFRLEYAADLVTALARLGLFAGGSDFGDMGAGALMISHVIHKARLEINEKGTTAAAATAGLTLGDIPFEMVVDRPFLCGIVDREGRTTLFLALVAEPNS